MSLMHTFVIPVYKESPYLKQCIQSLLNQTVKSRILITTSTPTDYSAGIAEKYGFDYLIGKEKGIANDWNFALATAAKGLVTIAHQDDIYEPEYAEKVTALMNKIPGMLIAFTDYHDLVDDQLRPATLNSFVKKVLLFPFVFGSIIKRKQLKKLLLSFGDPVCCPSVTFNMDTLTGFRFSAQFTCALDWYAWYQLAMEKGAFGFVNKKLIKHRIHTESETTLQLSQGIRKDEEMAMFRLIWGNGVAKILSWLYSLGHKANKV